MKRKQIAIAVVFAWAGLFTASSIAATVDGLVLHYTFDDAVNSQTAADSSGNGFDATMSSGSGWLPDGGQLGGALNCSGFRKAYPPQGCISNLTAVTVACWLKGATDNTSFFLGCATTNEAGAARIIDVSAGAAKYEMMAGYNGNNYSSRSVSGDMVADTANWVHWAMTFENVATNAGLGVITVYSNGVSVGVKDNVETDRVVSGIQFSEIGRANDGTFKGQLDDFRIYDRALSAAELATVMTGDTNSIPTNPSYDIWLSGYTLGAFTNQLDDAENGGIGDGLNNLLEYALGSAPDVVDVPADVLPISVVDGSVLNYIYQRQNPMDTNLTYTVLDGTDLTVGLINTNTAETVSAATNGFETVTNQVSTAVEGRQFMKLKVELD